MESIPSLIRDGKAATSGFIRRGGKPATRRERVDEDVRQPGGDDHDEPRKGDQASADLSLAESLWTLDLRRQ
jgi:hypothetical protein